MPNILYGIKMRSFWWAFYTIHDFLIMSFGRETWLMLWIVVLSQAAIPIARYT